jgi:hypothetical protein
MSHQENISRTFWQCVGLANDHRKRDLASSGTQMAYFGCLQLIRGSYVCREGGIGFQTLPLSSDGSICLLRKYIYKDEHIQRGESVI